MNMPKLFFALAGLLLSGGAAVAEPAPKQVSFGVISDVHHGVVDWARPGTGMVELDFVRAFLEDMRARKPDFIIQLGDFCKPSNGQPMLDLWNTFEGPRYHVLGNHERDGGQTFEAVAKWWGMPARYHTFDQGPVRGIVLDANEPQPGPGYSAYIGPEQREWLARTLAGADRPVVLFIHQPFHTLKNKDEMLAVLKKSEAERPGLVMAVLCGHNHQDYLLVQDGIPHIQINSASYVWYDKVRTVRYAEPLWGRVVVDFEAGVFRLHGKKTTWLDKDPWQHGAPEDGHYKRDITRPAISDRVFELKPETLRLARAARPDAPPPPDESEERPAARALPEAEGVFHQDSRWLGADAALSVPLAPERTLWLFGDTFIATSDARKRSQAKMVRNTVAVQEGADPRTARMSFHWGAEAGAGTDAFFPGRGERWYWPGHGVRLKDGPLVLFLYAMEKAGDGGPLGFACTGYALAVIEHPDAPPARWRPVVRDAPALGFDAIPATAAVLEDGHVVAVAIRQKGVHAGALVRYPLASLARGEVSGAQWWAGGARGWVDGSGLGPDGPSWVLDNAGAECSLHWSAGAKRYVHVASYGFGATTIGVRTAPALTGPWSAPATVFRPPESEAARPFVYAAKGHPELDGPDAGDLLVTYAANSFTFEEILRPPGDGELYWPRVVCVPGMR